MKKLAALFGLVFILMITGCKQKAPDVKEIPVPSPADLVTLDQAKEATGGTYNLALDGGAVKEEGNVRTALYLSDPIGIGDPVKVVVTSHTETITKEAIKKQFEAARDKRPKAIQVQGVGEAAYLAYPTLHLYDKGYLIEITAGSGDGDEQNEILKKLAQTAWNNLQTFYTNNGIS